ncbi:MAG: precorrin-4 C(11)-methyltransferase [Lachnospiraceae bacterium]|nr:precorrin-4 C(11)-methyltransferase [Lachnospiraceae bacterium]
MVDFVGAGPGAEDLITVRGMRLLQEADCIIYAGSLVNPGLLSYAGEDCQIYNSAKMHLEEVLAVMERMEAGGKHTVRLHTGDPSLYGAIREQMDALKKRGIPYRICPGVSSFCGAAAALEAEYTLPSVSQSVIITRMEGRTPVPEREKLHLLAQHGATMVLFLSSGMTRQVQEALLQGAYTQETPCAIVYKATWPEERVVRGTVGKLCKLAEENDIARTALIVVGDVLGEDYELSKLYDRHFTTGFRQGVEEPSVSAR